MKALLAIDPGQKGGLATSINGIVTVHKMPDTVKDLCNVIDNFKVEAIMASTNGTDQPMAYVEEVGGYTGVGQPGFAMFSFGRGFGNIEGALTALEVPFEFVRPQKWQKALGLGHVGTIRGDYQGLHGDDLKAEKKRIGALNAHAKVEWKNKLKSAAQRRFPHLDVTLSTADALLILEYAMQRENGTQL